MHKIEILEDGNIKIIIPMHFRNCAGRKRIITPDGEKVQDSSPLVLNIARAFHWQQLIDDGHYNTVQELANALGIDSSNVARTIRLTNLSPKLIHMAIEGTLPENIGSGTMRSTLPDCWNEQAQILDCPEALYE